MSFALLRDARKSFTGIALGAALVASLSGTPVHAQWKPDRAVEVVVGFAPGGGNDKSARIM